MVSRPDRSFLRAVSRSARRPVTRTFLPRLWKRRAAASPIPEVPPTIRMVLILEVMSSLLEVWDRFGTKLVAVIRRTVRAEGYLQVPSTSFLA